MLKHFLCFRIKPLCLKMMIIPLNEGSNEWVQLPLICCYIEFSGLQLTKLTCAVKDIVLPYGESSVSITGRKHACFFLLE